MESSLAERLREIAIADHLYLCLAAFAQVINFEAVIVMPGVGEEARLAEAIAFTRDHRTRRLISTGTNPEERARGECYSEAEIRRRFTIELSFAEELTIEADEVGDHSRMQAENAVRRLKAKPLGGPAAHIAGPWHGPRSYLTLLEKCLEEYGSIKAMPAIFPALVPVPLAEKPKAASDEHKASGYAEGLPAAIRAEIERRLKYEDTGHVLPLARFEEYFHRIANP